MMKIGVTGGIGSGKSIVCHMFERLSIPVFNADREAKSLLATDASARQKIKDGFGAHLFDENGKLNRQQLAEIVFNDKTKLEQLNAIVHPLVNKRFDEWTGENRNAAYVIKEAAILFESGSHKRLDKIIAVVAPEDMRIRRVMERDGVTEKEVRLRMKNQMDQEEKAQHSDHIINNDGKQALIPQVLELHSSFLK